MIFRVAVTFSDITSSVLNVPVLTSGLAVCPDEVKPVYRTSITKTDRVLTVTVLPRCRHGSFPGSTTGCRHGECRLAPVLLR